MGQQINTCLFRLTIMRRLPRKKTEKQNLIIKAVKDYFGEANAEEKKSIVKIACYLMGRKKRNPLTDEEKEIKDIIKINLKDKVYASGLVGNPQLEMRSGELRPQFSHINSEVSHPRGSLTHPKS